MKNCRTEVSSIDLGDFKIVIMNLMSLIYFRNVSRQGTVALIRTQYIGKAVFKPEKQLRQIQLAPKEVFELRKGKGEKERIAEVMAIVSKSHKNFHVEGVKYQVMRKKISR